MYFKSILVKNFALQIWYFIQIVYNCWHKNSLKSMEQQWKLNTNGIKHCAKKTLANANVPFSRNCPSSHYWCIDKSVIKSSRKIIMPWGSERYQMARVMSKLLLKSFAKSLAKLRMIRSNEPTKPSFTCPFTSFNTFQGPTSMLIAD